MFRYVHAKFSTLASTATSQNGVLTIDQLRQGDLSESQIKYRVQTGQLIRRPGQVFVVAGSADTWRREVTASALAAAQHARVEGGAVGAASHRSSARLFGFRTVDEDIDVSVRYPRKLLIPGTNVTRSRDLVPEDITWVDGIPTTTPERTIIDMGLKFPEHEVMRVLRHAISTGVVNRRDVFRIRLRTSKQGRDGTGIGGRCVESLPDFAEETESAIEVMFLELCEEHNLATPVLQLPVIANGRSYRLDFAYPTHKVFVEVDGAGHDCPVAVAKDGGRQNDLVAHGWTPLRLHYRQLKRSPDYCADLVHQLLNPEICDPGSLIIRP